MNGNYVGISAGKVLYKADPPASRLIRSSSHAHKIFGTQHQTFAMAIVRSRQRLTTTASVLLLVVVGRKQAAAVRGEKTQQRSKDAAAVSSKRTNRAISMHDNHRGLNAAHRDTPRLNPNYQRYQTDFLNFAMTGMGSVSTKQPKKTAPSAPSPAPANVDVDDGDSGEDNGTNIQHPKGCSKYRYRYRVDDIEVGKVQTSVGSTDFFPVFDPDSEEELGVYQQATTDLRIGQDTHDCVLTGAYSFDFDEEEDSRYKSQIYIQGTCNGRFYAVTGGSGAFGCATGYGIPVADGTNETTGFIELFLCKELCPM